MIGNDVETMADQQILEALSGQVRRTRLDKNITQQQLADKAGVGVATLRRFESGEGNLSLLNLIAVLRALGQLDRLQPLLDSVTLSPVARLREQGGGIYQAHERQRARPAGEEDDQESTWEWGDE